MADPIIYIDRSRIRPSRFEEVEREVEELVGFIEAEEPQLLSYGIHLDEQRSRMTVVAVHPDPASLELHLEVGAAAFREFADLIELEGIEVYGEPTERGLQRLREKAGALGEGGAVVVDPLHAGFSRLSA